MDDLVAWTLAHQWIMNLAMILEFVVIAPCTYIIGRAHGRKAALRDLRAARWQVVLREPPKPKSDIQA